MVTIKPVFISLNRPYCVISCADIASILQDTIKLAGLDSTHYSAKSFRPTGATTAIASGCEPNIIPQIGRWKTQDFF